jgi:hypothetical protein
VDSDGPVMVKSFKSMSTPGTVMVSAPMFRDGEVLDEPVFARLFNGERQLADGRPDSGVGKGRAGKKGEKNADDEHEAMVCFHAAHRESLRLGSIKKFKAAGPLRCAP